MSIAIRILLFFSLVCLLQEANSQNTFDWNATVTHAQQTTQRCGDGSIVLHPPSSINTLHGYSFSWTKRSLFGPTPIPFSNDKDIFELGPGYYTVEIVDPYCGTIILNYSVHIRDYNFDIAKFNPTNCEPRKPGPNAPPGNGAIKISWNHWVTPPPTITMLPSNTSISNGTWITDLNYGDYEINFDAGNCQWTVPIVLCCCSVTEDFPLEPGIPGICENVSDGIPFTIEAFEIHGASSSNERDGSLIVTIESPGPDWSIEWTGPAGFVGTGPSLRNLVPGEYCYEYTDECQSQSDCFIVDDCSVHVNTTELRTVQTCHGEPDGELLFLVENEPKRRFTIHHVHASGLTGSQENIEVGSTIDDLVRVRITNLLPGVHTFRLISEQFCERDFELEVPEVLTDVRNRDFKDCEEDVYCDGEFVYTRKAPKLPVFSQYCFIQKYKCDMKGARVQSNNNFDPGFADDYIENVDGTCSFIYYCSDDNPLTINGIIEWEYLGYTCPDADEADLFLPQVQIGRFCKTNVSGYTISLFTEQTMEIDAVAGPLLGECKDCELKPPVEFKAGQYREYSWTSDSGNTEVFQCCGPNCDQTRPSSKLYAQSANELLECYSEFGFNSCRFVNLGSGTAIELNDSQMDILLQQIRKDLVIKSSDLGYRLSPGSYALTSSTCNTIRVTII